MRRRRLELRGETIAVLGAELRQVRAGRDISCPSVPPQPCETACTDGNNGCVSEAGGCHTGWTGCGTC